MDNNREIKRVSTGIKSLDKVLRGGLPIGEMYVVSGSPGTGKTTLALHFLAAGSQMGEQVLCLSLAQRIESLKQTAYSVGIDISNVIFKDFSSVEALQSLMEQQTIFDTSEVEMAEMMQAFTQVIEDVQPERVVFDGISHLRMLANHALTYRQELFTLRDYMSDRVITTLLTDTREVAPRDHELSAIAHGVINLSIKTTSHGSDHRYMHIPKIRGIDYALGQHDVEISHQGMRVYQSYRAIPAKPYEYTPNAYTPSNPIKEGKLIEAKTITSGLEALDQLIGGGLLSGTTCLLVGPSGTGKTSLSTAFARQFVKSGGKVSLFLFDELTGTLTRRAQGLGIAIDEFVSQDRIRLHELSFGNITPGKLNYLIEHDVETWGAGMVIIDTLTGYLSAMPNENRLIAQMHELLMGLSRRDIMTFVVVAQHGVIGPTLEVPVDISYLADTVLLLRHFEAEGELRQAVSVYKKRFGAHERRIREIQLQPGKIKVGEPLRQFSGILTGTPSYTGESSHLIEKDQAD